MSIHSVLATMRFRVLAVGAVLFSVGVIAFNLLVLNSAGVLGTEGCRMPCWRGIKPGASRAHEVLRVLAGDMLVRSWAMQDRIGFVANGKEVNPEFFRGLRSINWHDWRTNRLSSAFIRNDIVVLVQFGNYTRLTLGDVISEAGAPERHVAFLTEYRVITRYLAYFPSNGLVVSADYPQVAYLRLHPGLAVSEIYYFEPMTAEAMFRMTPIIPTYGTERCTTDNWMLWRDYESIAVLPHELQCRPGG